MGDTVQLDCCAVDQEALDLLLFSKRDGVVRSVEREASPNFAWAKWSIQSDGNVISLRGVLRRPEELDVPDLSMGYRIGDIVTIPQQEGSKILNHVLFDSPEHKGIMLVIGGKREDD